MARIKGGHTDPSCSRDRGQEPPHLWILLKPRLGPYLHPREECPLALLNGDTPCEDHQCLLP
ncbi:hypothetical protein AAG906_017447 [Vitis piasezkii]